MPPTQPNPETPTLVLLPGMDGTGGLFAPLIDALGLQIRTQVVRYPTTGPQDYVSLETLVRAQLPSTPFVLLGESFSGPIAIALAAAKHPQLMALVLSTSFASNPHPIWGSLSHYTQLLPLGLAPIGLIDRLALGRWSTPALRVLLEKAMHEPGNATMQARLKAVLSVDVTEPLKTIRVPMLYLRAQYDRLVPHAAAQCITQHQPNTNLVTLAGPHCLLQALPTQAAGVLKNFIQASSAAYSASPPVAASASSGPPWGQVNLGSGPAIDLRDP